MKRVKLLLLTGLTSLTATAFAATDNTTNADLAAPQSNQPTVVSTQEQPQAPVATETTASDATSTQPSTEQQPTTHKSKHAKSHH